MNSSDIPKYVIYPLSLANIIGIVARDLGVVTAGAWGYFALCGANDKATVLLLCTCGMVLVLIQLSVLLYYRQARLKAFRDGVPVAGHVLSKLRPWLFKREAILVEYIFDERLYQRTQVIPLSCWLRIHAGDRVEIFVIPSRPQRSVVVFYDLDHVEP